MTGAVRPLARPLVERLARWLHGAVDGLPTAGDLEEDYARQRVRRGRLRAEIEYARQGLLLLWWATRDALPLPRRHRGDAEEGVSGAGRGALARDLRYALRALIRRWPVAGVAAGVIALGVGLNVAMFAVVDATLLRPFAFPEAERLRLLYGTLESQGWTRAALSIPEIGDFVERSDRIDEIGIARAGARLAMTSDGLAEKVEASFVDSAYFRVLGVAPLRGRHFTAAEDQARGGSPVVVVSHHFWQTRLGGADDVLQRDLRLSQRDYRIVGVMPPGFLDVANGYDPTDVWLPLSMGAPFMGPTMFETRSHRQYGGVLRLPAGVTAADVQADLDRIARELALEYPDTHRFRGATAWALNDYFFDSLRTPIRVLLGGAVLVLLICCVNVGAMLLAQTYGRLPELAVRRALGATRRHVVSQLLAESLLLAFVGGVLGIGLAAWTLRAAQGAYVLGLPSFADVRIGPGVLAATGLVLAGCACAFGLVPALRLTRGGEAGGLASRRSVVGPASRRFAWTLVAAEAAVAAVLLSGAGLAASDLRALLRQPVGYTTDALLTARFDLTRGSTLPTDPEEVVAARAAEDARRVEFAERLVAQVEAVPGVEAAGLIGPDVLGNANWHIRLFRPGEESADPAELPLSQRLVITPGTLDALQLRLLRGRDLRDSDRAGSENVALVDERFAAAFFPGEDPVGREVHTQTGTPYRIVGLVESARHRGRLVGDDVVLGDFYVSYYQEPWTWVSAVVRTSGDDVDIVPSFRRAVAAVDPNVVMDDLAWMRERMARSESVPRFVAHLAATYAAVAGLLAFVGTYGVLAYVVRARRREIAVRSALGAPRRRTLRRLLGLGLFPALAGTALGLAVVFGLAPWLQGLLTRVDVRGGSVYLAAAAVLVAGAASASLVPAWRASRIDPMEVLRDED